MARSDDRGATWTLTQVPGLLDPVAVRVAPSIPSTIYAVGYTDLYRSTTAGLTWVRRNVPMTAQFQRDLQVDANNSSTIVMASWNFCFLGCSGGGVYRSDNGGGSWKAIGFKDKNVDSVALDPTTSQVVYAITGARLYRTGNGGGSWADITPPVSTSIQSVAVDPAVSTTIYAGVDNEGLYRSTDSGRSWELIRTSRFGALISAAAPTPGSREIIASADGVAFSRDGGRTWQELRTAGSGLDFRGLWQIVVTAHACYMVSDLAGSPGSILDYEPVSPRRRAAGQ